VTSPDELKRAVNAVMDSGKPTVINAVIDRRPQRERRIGNLNPQSKIRKKYSPHPDGGWRHIPSPYPSCHAGNRDDTEQTMTKALKGVRILDFPRPVGTDLHAIAGLVRR